jgi:hypothetical protein
MKKTSNKSNQSSGLIKSEVILFAVPTEKLPHHIQSIRKTHEAKSNLHPEKNKAQSPTPSINLNQLRVEID